MQDLFPLFGLFRRIGFGVRIELLKTHLDRVLDFVAMFAESIVQRESRALRKVFERALEVEVSDVVFMHWREIEG